MIQRPSASTLGWFAATVLVSAFLVFQVQPVVSKAILPWFGGSPAVWTTCMLFFQTLLFAGYAYAHLLTRWLPVRWQGGVHFALLVVALLVLPVVPDETWKPAGADNPTWSILGILAANVGLPYFVLSATGPLVQAWFRQSVSGRSPYRLYALSNAGSLAALLSFPFLIEPAFSTAGQNRLWSLGFGLFAVACGYLAATRMRTVPAGQAPAADEPAGCTESRVPSWQARVAWLLLPAFASIVLLATTNHVCQDVAVVPFLWIAPLSLYLISFIVCFDREQWYSSRWFSAASLATLLALNLIIQWEYQSCLALEVGLYCAALFLLCMVCHGELARSKPDARYLTGFYLTSAGGGALGGFVVAVVCPLVFSSYLEMNCAVLLGAAFSLVVLLRDAQRTWLGDSRQRRLIAGLFYFAVFVFVGLVQFDPAGNPSWASVRNFYGVLHVRGGPESSRVALVHGRIFHGLQFRDPQQALLPTAYYGPDSGVSMALTRRDAGQPMRVGAVGLGCGTVAAYGAQGDYYRFYEINPAVVDIAQRHFTYLKDSAARIDVVLGDARVSLEREPTQAFDVLVLDAFNGDAVPTHLLTREACEVYLRHLRPDGVLAIHISNRHLRLDSVVRGLAEHFQLPCVSILNAGDFELGVLPAEWMLLTRDTVFLAEPRVRSSAHRAAVRAKQPPRLWTDQHSNLFEILTVR